jgi:hypothetical protein
VCSLDSITLATSQNELAHRQVGYSAGGGSGLGDEVFFLLCHSRSSTAKAAIVEEIVLLRGPLAFPHWGVAGIDIFAAGFVIVASIAPVLIS